MSTPFLSQIAVFSFGFAPRGWATCSGQLLPINQNQALFSLLGTTYGGNGQTTFALPDLRGRAPLGAGQGPGLGVYSLGQTGGSETVALAVSEMPAHNHTIDVSQVTATANCRNEAATQRTPKGNLPAKEAANVTATYSNAAADGNMSSGGIVMGGSVTVGVTGSGLGHENRQPHIPLTYCIALAGIYPSQN